MITSPLRLCSVPPERMSLGHEHEEPAGLQHGRAPASVHLRHSGDVGASAGMSEVGLVGAVVAGVLAAGSARPDAADVGSRWIRPRPSQA